MKDQKETSVVDVDELQLDKECIRLPSQYLRHANLAAEAKRDVAEAKASLSVIKADLAREIREKPGEFGLEKATEAAVEAVIQSNGAFKKGSGAIRELEHILDMAQAVVAALEIKKRSLTLLVELHGMKWFSAPKVSPEGREATRERMKDLVYGKKRDKKAEQNED